jgi:hypothetical protein
MGRAVPSSQKVAIRGRRISVIPLKAAEMQALAHMLLPGPASSIASPRLPMKDESSTPGSGHVEPPTRPAPRRKLTGRKLLIASVGVATVNYVLSCTEPSSPTTTTSGNLVGPPPRDTSAGKGPGLPPTSGNLGGPLTPLGVAGQGLPPTSGNLAAAAPAGAAAPPPAAAGSGTPPLQPKDAGLPPLHDAGNEDAG